jgi:hypothetical protein
MVGKKPDPPAGGDEGEEIVTPLADPTDFKLIRRIATTGGKKYTAGNIDRGKYQRRGIRLADGSFRQHQ